MKIIPSIYILNGKVVSLYKGKVSQKETYYQSPQEMVEKFVDAGAKEVFLLDLNGSTDDKLLNENKILPIIKSFPDTNFYIGGGISNERLLDKLFNLGVKNIVLGTSARAKYKNIISNFPIDKIFFGLKSLGDKVIIKEKDKVTTFDVLNYAIELEEMGAKNVIYADIASQGTMTQPNYDEVDRLILATNLNVYTQGGIGSYKIIKLLDKIGTKGIFIGKAFYENKLPLRIISSV